MRKEIRPDKLRDMTRSILPSRRSRRSAWGLKAKNTRNVRRDVRRDLRQQNDEVDLTRSANQRGIVWWRRMGDKLNHFMRWCDALTAGMPTDRALSFVRSILPRTVIGDHAYEHWEAYRRYQSIRYDHADYLRRQQQSAHDRLRYWLTRALEIDPDLLARLNAAIKDRKKPDEPRRLLHGVHDIPAFVKAVRECWCYGAEERIAIRLITEVLIADGPKRRVMIRV